MIPEHMLSSLQRYIDHGISPGHFLTAVICNDLYEAACRADEINRRLLYEYVFLLHNEAPHQCWGSHEKFATWCEKRGANGLLAQRHDGEQP